MNLDFWLVTTMLTLLLLAGEMLGASRSSYSEPSSSTVLQAKVTKLTNFLTSTEYVKSAEAEASALTNKPVFSKTASSMEVTSSATGILWQDKGHNDTTDVTSPPTASVNPVHMSTTLTSSVSTDVAKNSTVRLRGIGIRFCPIWSCYKRCFQKTNNAPASESSVSATGNASSSSNDTVQTRCTCDHSCIRLGDCCVDFFSLCLNITDEEDVIQLVEHELYDAPTASNTEEQFELNITQMILSYGSCVVTPEGEKYTMISSCPSSFDDLNTVTICTEAGKHPHLQPYSDVDDMALTFRNLQCAHCHSYDEDRLLPWLQGLACQHAGALQEPSAAEDSPSSSAGQKSYLDNVLAIIQSGNCTYIYRPPENAQTQPRPCLSSSSELEHLDPDLHTATDANVSNTDSVCTFEDMLLCKAYSYQTFTSEQEEVKNPHCLKCMTGSTPVNVDLPCARAANRTWDSEGSSKGQGGILALFSTDRSGANSIMVNGHAIPMSGISCGDDQVFDYVFLVCRTLFCPAGYRPVHGQCSPVERYIVPAASQMVPSGTEKLHLTFDMKDNKSCEKQSLEDIVSSAFHNMFKHHPAPSFTFSCVSAQSGSHGEDSANSSHSDRDTVYMTIQPVTNLSEAFSSLKGMLKALSFVRDFVVTNYDTEPTVECAVGLPDLVHRANVTEIDGSLHVERSEGSATLFYPLTNTVFKTHLSQSNTSEEPVLCVYVSMLCVQPRVQSSLNCSSVAFDINQTRVENGTLFIINTDLSYPESQYEFHDGFVLVCSDFENLNDVKFFHFSDAQYYLSWACSVTSVVCLMASLVAFALLPYLKTLAGHMTASLAGSLALGQLLILVDFISYRAVCSILAAICHFCWLAAFTWMTALAVHMTRTFFGSMVTKTGKLNVNEVRREYKKYSIGGWGVPALLVATFVILDSVKDTPFEVGYGTPLCGWMRQSYVFLIPVAVALAVNVICFLLTLVSIERTMRASRAALTRQQTNDRQRLVVYTKMMGVMGFTWVAGFLASFTTVTAFWWIYIVLNGLQGTFIAFSFVLNARLIRFLKAEWSARNSTCAVPKGSGTGSELQHPHRTSRVPAERNQNQNQNPDAG